MSNSFTLHHLVRQPLHKSTQTKPPLLVLLHGFGSNEHDLFALAPFFDERLLIISVRAPLTLAHGSYAWYALDWTSQGIRQDLSGAAHSRAVLAQFLNEVLGAYNADPGQVFLAGFSQGAITSLSFALTHPGKIAGAALMSGAVLTNLEQVASSDPPVTQFIVTHGTDDGVLPIVMGRAVRDLLQARGITHEYFEYPMAHEISDACLDDVTGWISRQLDF
jgi:phospholipase/carboxylesterase